ncbi:MAG: hypothetical protein WCF30_15210 [Terracidiphilus sp.]
MQTRQMIFSVDGRDRAKLRIDFDLLGSVVLDLDGVLQCLPNRRLGGIFGSLEKHRFVGLLSVHFSGRKAHFPSEAAGSRNTPDATLLIK